MCQGDDRGCPEFEHHRRQLLADLGHERRAFLKSAVATMGGIGAAAGGLSLVTPAMAQAAAAAQPAKRGYHYLPATAETVHWGYFSKLLKPQVEVESGDLVTIEVLTHHANDDAEQMIQGDPGAESVFYWTKEQKNVNRRGAGPMDASIHGRGAGEGFGVHICTGPVYVRGAEPGDVLEVRILDTVVRPSANPAFAGKAFGSNAAAWWGYHYNDLLTEPKPREVITIYEVDATGERNWAGPSTTTNGHRRPTRSAWSTRSSTIPACRSTTPRSPRTSASSRTCACRSGRISAWWPWRRARPTWSIRSRPATSAATSTIGASARVR